MFLTLPLTIAATAAAGLYVRKPRRRAALYRAAARAAGAAERRLAERARAEEAVSAFCPLADVLTAPSRAEVMRSWLVLYS